MLPDADLLEAWHQHLAGVSTPFTIPGHKRRVASWWPGLDAAVGNDVPLYGGLGPVKEAVAVLGRAERRGAELWGADWCRYSTGGSTHANQAAQLAVARPGAPILVTRTAHRSTLLGMVLAGSRPVWLPAELDGPMGLPTGVSLPALEAALAAEPAAAAVLLVEPGYLGAFSDLPAAVDLAHRAGVPVVVDQAWGAHVGFHPAYPAHALAAGADVLVTSAHKTLVAASQGAVLAARLDRLDADRLERAFEATGTTSPSGTTLASIDASRALLGSPLGVGRLGALVDLVAGARARLRAEPALADAVVLGPEDFPPGRFDPAKLVLLLARSALSGNDLETRLLAAGVSVEQADRDTLVPIVTLADDEESIDALLGTIVLAARDLASGTVSPPSLSAAPVAAAATWQPDIAVAALTPRDAFFAPHETVPVAEAVGRVSAEVVAPYPPGIPVLAPGELVTAATLAALADAVRTGVRIAYAADPTLATLQVVRSPALPAG